MQRFENKRILVTGASSGIGFAAAAQLAREGASILAVARDLTRLEHAMQQWSEPARHVALSVDVRDEDALDAAVLTMRQSKQTLDGAVLCAGQHALRPLQVAKLQWMNELLASNLTATLLCSKLVLKTASSAGCSLVWLSSVAALTGNAAEVVYSAAKGALVSACRSAAVEFSTRRIRVNVVAPAVVETPMSAAWLAALAPDQLASVKQRHLLGFGTPSDVAPAIVFLLSDEARWITGTTLVVDGGFSCH